VGGVTGISVHGNSAGEAADPYARFLAGRDISAVLDGHVEEVGDCLEWTGCFGTGRCDSTPIINRLHLRLSVPLMVWLVAKGPVPAGKLVYRHCCNWRCVRLEHLRCAPRGEHLRHRARRGLAAHLQSTRANISKAMRKRSQYSAEQAEAVRELAALGIPDVLIAGATDVGVDLVADIRLGRAWADRAPAASVFGWRP